jgi:hypothetical protein
MYKIYSDFDSFYYNRYKHGALGNKILHMYFLINLAETRQRIPAFYDNINVNKIFDFNQEFSSPPEKINDFYYVETEPYWIQNFFLDAIGRKNYYKNKNLKSVVGNAKKFHERSLSFLEKDQLPDKDIMIRGWFFDYLLMPSFEQVQKYLKPSKSLTQKVLSDIPGIVDKKSVAVHFRGTDFSKHLSWVFKDGVKLTEQYYRLSISEIKKELGNDLTFYLFSDEPETLESFFVGEKTVIHTGSAIEAWIALFLAKNVIQSNSSFCWSACLYDKSFSIQPLGGYNLYRPELGNVPYSFAHPHSTLLPAY